MTSRRRLITLILPLTVDTYMRRCDDLTCIDRAPVEILNIGLCASVMRGKGHVHMPTGDRHDMY